MAEESSFVELIGRVRSGDEAAARELVKRYEPYIRRVVRAKLTDRRLRRQMDSVDICQSVLGNFFVRVALGQFDLSCPEQLVKLLATIARNRVVEEARKQHAAVRDIRRLDTGGLSDSRIDGGQDTPSQLVVARELLQKFRERLTEEEKRIADARAREQGWAEIGVQMGMTPDALRMRWTRTVDRLAHELGLVNTHG
ncbi:MAG: sigma-70 family RNA polymerase sigma factor [Planctomycetia bacterium]|nr:sigma-70 family RNA polymerase sigma factor [Planctomycetia bacterium]